jgi:hypothetical protein
MLQVEGRAEVRQNSERRRTGVVLSALAAFVFFTFAWHGSVSHSWAGALGGGVLMGLLVFGSQWFLMRGGTRRSAQPGWRGK